MIVFAGLPVKITDAVFADHIKVERTAIFVGRAAFAAFHAWARNPKTPDTISGPFHKSLRTKRSVRMVIPDGGSPCATPW